MAQKKLEKDSTFSDLDLDGDGVVSDQELKTLAAIEASEKMDSQRRMAPSAGWRGWRWGR